MLVTVTPNPSLDRTLEVDELRRGTVVRADRVRVDPGGKGVNVAMALVANGQRVRAVLPLGGHEGEQLRDAVERAGIEVHPVPITDAVRTNLSLVEPDGTVTKVNAPGPRLSAEEATRLAAVAGAAANGASWLAGCGSLPPGAPTSFYADLVLAARAAGAQVAIDASGAAFTAALLAGPDLVKPNVDELAEATGRTLVTLHDVLAAADELRARGVACVVVSLGADGAVLVDDAGAWHAVPPPIAVRNAVGAGDALVAGLLAAGGQGPTALRAGVAYGSAAAALPGTQLPGPDDLDLDAVEVRQVDPARELTDVGGTR